MGGGKGGNGTPGGNLISGGNGTLGGTSVKMAAKSRLERDVGKSIAGKPGIFSILRSLSASNGN